MPQLYLSKTGHRLHQSDTILVTASEATSEISGGRYHTVATRPCVSPREHSAQGARAALRGQDLPPPSPNKPPTPKSPGSPFPALRKEDAFDSLRAEATGGTSTQQGRLQGGRKQRTPAAREPCGLIDLARVQRAQSNNSSLI